jgi:hypothetical protein
VTRYEALIVCDRETGSWTTSWTLDATDIIGAVRDACDHSEGDPIRELRIVLDEP